MSFVFASPRRCVKRWMTGTFYICVFLLSHSLRLSVSPSLSLSPSRLSCIFTVLGHSVYSIRWPTRESIYREEGSSGKPKIVPDGDSL